MEDGIRAPDLLRGNAGRPHLLLVHFSPGGADPTAPPTVPGSGKDSEVSTRSRHRRTSCGRGYEARRMALRVRLFANAESACNTELRCRTEPGPGAGGSKLRAG